MPTIDKRYLAKLLVVVVLLAGALFGVHAFQAERIPAALKRQAERAIAADKPETAIRHLRQFLEFEPDDVDVQAQLSDLLRGRPGTHNELHFLYDRILRCDPSRAGVRREALTLALRTGRYSDALTHGEALTKSNPNDAVVWQQLAAAQAGLRLFDAARNSYETAVKLDPKDALAWQRLGQFLAADLKKPDEARKSIDRMVAALPDNAASYLTRIRLAQMTDADKPLPQRKSDPVLADIAKALELSPENPELLLLKAERLQLHRDVAGARTALADGVAKYPADQRLVRALAWLEVNRNNLAGAVGVLEDALPHVKDGLDLLVPLADLLLDNGDVAKVEEILRKLDRRGGANVKMQAKYLRSRLAMKAAQWNDAVAILAGLRSDAVNLPVLETQSNLLLSQCFQKLGEPEKAIDTLKLISAKDATHVATHVALGQLYLNAGRTADAIKAYESAVQSPFAPPSAITMLIRMQSLKLAQSNAKPEAWTTLERQIQIFSARYGKNAAEPVILKAELATQAGRWKDAVAILKAESTRQPQSTALWCKLAETIGNIEGVAAGLAVLDEALGFVPDSADLRLARAKLYAKDPARLRPLDLLLNGVDAWSDQEQMQFATGMIEVYDSIGQKNRELWQRILARRPNDLDTWLTYARQFPDEQSRREARPCVVKLAPRLLPYLDCITAKSIDSDLYGRFCGTALDRADLCLFMATQVKGKESQVLLATASRMEPNSFETITAVLTDKAVRLDEPGMQTVLSRLAADPRWVGDPMRRAVQKALASEVLRPTSGANAKNQGTDASRSPQEFLLAALRPHIERQPAGLGWLADQYRLLSQYNYDHPLNPKLIEVCNVAVASPMATVDDWFRLAMSTQKSDRAPVMERAHKRLTESQFAMLNATLDLYPYNGIIRMLPMSRDELSSRLSIFQSQLNRDLAILNVEEFLKQKPVPADRAWAARQLAMLLVIRGEPADRERAAKLLTDSPLTEAGTTVTDRRTTASTLAGLYRYLDDPIRNAAIRRAIELMESAAKESQSPKDAFVLCRLYKSAGRTDDAVATLRRLLNGDPGNVDYLLAGLDVLVEAKQYGPARGFAERLMQLAGDEFRVVAAVARYEALTGNASAALALAEGYFRTADPLAGDVPAKTARTAELLDDLSRLPTVLKTPAAGTFIDAAAAKYESLLPGRAEAIIRLAALLAAADRSDEAFARIEKLQRGLPPRIVATAAITALRIAGGTDKQFARTRQWLDLAAFGSERNTLPQLLCEAEFLALQGDVAEAATIYEAVLREYPRSVTALNNLAWLLAAKPETCGRALELLDRAAKETGLTGELLDTRSRIRLAAKQPLLAVQDAGEALKHDKSALRYFHLALATREVKPEEMAQYFREAKSRGLTDRQVHPADVPLFKELEKEIR